MLARKTIITALSGALALTIASSNAFARGQIQIVGSSTVFPFATAVAERFGKNTKFKTPVVESTGTGGGLKLFCAGVGENTPDITNASRRIKSSEVVLCTKNGVKDIVEVKVGYDGIVLANSRASGEAMNISVKDLFLALAKQVPNADGKLIANPYINWSQINAALPAVKIEVLGPPPTSGTRDAFVELVMDTGCDQLDAIKAMKADKAAHSAVCNTIREDGAFIEAGENDNLIVQKLEANKDAFGIFGYSYLEQNADKIQGSMIEGKEPTFDAIAAGDYPVSRSLFFYVKKVHIGVTPGMEAYLAEFISKDAVGEEGYLADKGLIPMKADEAATWVTKVKNLENLAM